VIKQYDTIIAIDPAKKCGVANKEIGESFHDTTVNVVDIMDLKQHLKGIQGKRFLVIIERSTCTTPMFRAHRAHANNAASVARSLWPRMNKIVFVDPQEWQRAVLGKFPKGKSKVWSMRVGSNILRRNLDDNNMTDAVCILYYGEKVKLLEL